MSEPPLAEGAAFGPYELLAGRPARSGDVGTVLAQALQEDVDLTRLRASEPLRTLGGPRAGAPSRRAHRRAGRPRDGLAATDEAVPAAEPALA